MVISMTNKIKFLIIIALSLFMIQAVSASDDVVSAPNNEVVNDVSYDVVSASNDEVVNDVSYDVVSDIVVDEVIEEYEDDEDNSIYDDILCVDEDSYPQDYNDSDIMINSYEKSFEIENSQNQYNNAYIEECLVDSFNIPNGLNYTEEISCQIVDNFLSDGDISIRMISEFDFETYDLSRCEFKFDEFNPYDLLLHDILIFNNHNAHVLVHAVDKDISFCNDKLNSKFVFCIDYSIVGSANISNLLVISFSPQSFSQYFSTSFYSNEYVYNFFSLFYNKMNEVYSFRI